jgi:hypothetical protein
MGALEGKTALVTGAAGSIGSETALALAEQGARVVLTDLRREIVAELAHLADGDSYSAFQLGQLQGAVERAAQTLVRQVGPVVGGAIEQAWQQGAARLGQGALYALLIAVPVLGFLSAAAVAKSVSTSWRDNAPSDNRSCSRSEEMRGTMGWEGEGINGSRHSENQAWSGKEEDGLAHDARSDALALGPADEVFGAVAAEDDDGDAAGGDGGGNERQGRAIARPDGLLPA